MLAAIFENRTARNNIAVLKDCVEKGGFQPQQFILELQPERLCVLAEGSRQSWKGVLPILRFGRDKAQIAGSSTVFRADDQRAFAHVTEAVGGVFLRHMVERALLLGEFIQRLHAVAAQDGSRVESFNPFPEVQVCGKSAFENTDNVADMSVSKMDLILCDDDFRHGDAVLSMLWRTLSAPSGHLSQRERQDRSFYRFSPRKREANVSWLPLWGSWREASERARHPFSKSSRIIPQML